MPNFLVIGAAKAGTTSLYTYLQQHPQIYLSPVKETNFFAMEGENLNYKYPASKTIDNYLSQCQTDLHTYQKLFEGVSDEKAIGEISPMYLYETQAPERIHHYIPDVKLIAILRNPVDRAYSGFLHTIRDNLEPIADFEQAIQEEPKRRESNWWWGFFYVHPGFYYEQLTRYFQKFERSQIKIYLYEDFQKQPTPLLQDLFRFLQVNESFMPDMSAKYNVTGIPRNKVLYKALNQRNLFTLALRLLLPSKLYESFTTDIKNRSLTKPELTSDVRKHLIQVYKEDILKLQDLLQKDLSAWLK
ncbi:MAG: sulfotransferase domain-containing protein [Cyanophyceae cyanobacterium]